MKLYRINALLLKYYYITKNRLDRLFDLFYWPLLDIFLWGFATVYIQSLSDSAILAFFLGGVILWMFVWRATQDLAVFILEDFWSRNLYNLFSSPVTSTEIIISNIIFGVLRAFVSFILMVVLAFLLYSFNILTLGFVGLALYISALMLFGWAIGIFVSGLIVRFGQRIQVFAWSVPWVMQPFSCIFYPLASLPNWAQVIAKLLPTTYIFEGMRFTLATGSVNYGFVGKAFIISFILLIITSWFFKRSLKAAKKSGLLSRYN